MDSWLLIPSADPVEVNAPSRFAFGCMVEKAEAKALVGLKNISSHLIFVANSKKRHRHPEGDRNGCIYN